MNRPHTDGTVTSSDESRVSLFSLSLERDFLLSVQARAFSDFSGVSRCDDLLLFVSLSSFHVISRLEEILPLHWGCSVLDSLSEKRKRREESLRDENPPSDREEKDEKSALIPFFLRS